MENYFNQKSHFKTVEYSQGNDNTKLVFVDLDETLFNNVPVMEIPRNLRKSKDAPLLQRLASYVLAPTGYLLKRRDKPVSCLAIRLMNSVCRNIPYKDLGVPREKIEVNEKVVDFIRELKDRGVEEGRNYRFLILSHTPTKLIEDYMNKINLGFDYEVKGIELDIRGGRVYGFDCSDPFTRVMLTEGGKAAKDYYAAKLISEGNEIEGAIGNTFPDDFPMNNGYEGSGTWGLHTPVNGNWRLHTDLRYASAEDGRLVSPRRPEQIFLLIGDHLAAPEPTKYIEVLQFPNNF
jgi:phosphoserine phosphatase